MSHPLVFWKKPFFYAIGNTPAICLTQDLAPEEAANILLLGCGDPRNILFTIYSIGIAGPIDLDFTCCDVDPAVLARNVLLLTLLADDTTGNNVTKIWNIFYHIKLDQDSLSLLLSQSQKLFELSETIETWNNCQYGPFLQLCTRRTLSQLRRYWESYVKTGQMSNAQRKQFNKKFAAGLKEVTKKGGSQTNQNITACRSAGPAWIDAVMVAPEAAAHYWKTGITNVDQKAVAAATFPNPSLAYSAREEEFAVHYGADPILGFHLAPAFVPTKPKSQSAGEGKSLQHVVETAMTQFSVWGEAFRTALAVTKKAGKLVIRIFSGDALAFCKALNYCGANKSIETGLYAAWWTVSQLILDGGAYGEDAISKAPLMFNIIDTSNLTDHLGLLNILVVTVPLLSRAPSSTLYTESLVASGEDPMTAFIERMCADIPTISLLLGLIPPTFVSNITSHSNVHEIMSSKMMGGCRQFHERIAWKTVSLADPVSVENNSDCNRPLAYDPEQLGRFLFGVYLKMFHHEDVVSSLKNVSLQGLYELSMINYNRSSFVELLRLVKARTQTDWEKVAGWIIDLIEADRKLLLGLNNYQAFLAQLYILDVYTVQPLRLNPQSIKFSPRLGKLATWKSCPAVVCVVMVVSRDTLKVLTEMDAENMGSPLLQCDVRSPMGLNIYSSIHPVFATLKTEGAKGDMRILLEEDPAGWGGKCPLVVSFWVPAWTIMSHPDETFVALGIRSTPQSTQAFLSKLGPPMHIIETKLNHENVFVVRERPNLWGELEKVKSVSLDRHFSTATTSGSVKSNPISVALDPTGQQMVTLSVRVDVVAEDLRSKLASGVDVTTSQTLPCTIEVKIGSFKKPLVFPYPVDGTRAKLRIARKSSYVEVIAPIAGPKSAGGFSINNFPVVLHKKTPIVWNLHRLNLERLPAVDISKVAKLRWIETHTGLQFSDNERDIRTRFGGDYGGKNLFLDLKDSIAHLIIQYVGLQGSKSRVFALSDKEQGGIYTIIFCTDLLLDLASHTIVVDACVMPLSHKIVDLAQIGLHNLSRDPLVSIYTIGKETKAWKNLLTAFVERCRSWKHRENCNYITKGIPVSTDYDQSPLCTCAPGNASPEFLKVRSWQQFAKHVTRAAISPLFAVSYLEPVAGGLESTENTLSRMKQMPVVDEKDGCFNCGKGGELMRCSRCRKARYCTAECQKTDWKKHKAACK